MSLDDGFFAEAGLGDMPQALIDSLRKRHNERLERRIEARVTAILTDRQYETYNSFFASEDAAAAFDYVKRVVPWYESIVAAETSELEQGLREEAPLIRAIEESLAAVSDGFEQSFRRLDSCGSE
ncbi:MAG: hypothetical protein ACYDC2_02175, partial [Solirubrobacteraceae bacterium]